MTDQQLIDAALEQHKEHGDGRHKLDTCPDPGCRAARWIIESRKCYKSGDIGMAHSAETMGE